MSDPPYFEKRLSRLEAAVFGNDFHPPQQTFHQMLMRTDALYARAVQTLEHQGGPILHAGDQAGRHYIVNKVKGDNR